MPEHDAKLTFLIVLITVCGMGAQWLAWRFRLPAILLLALAGITIGPVLGLLNPSQQLGAMLNPLIGLSVAIILFEGGMNLRLHEFRAAGPGVMRLATACVAITWVLGSVAAHFVAGLSWPVAVLFGAITIVTGPTVIIPMLRQAKLKRRPASLLKWEGIINDPVGALLAVLVFEYFLYRGSGVAIFEVLTGLAAALAAALVLGGGGGYLLGQLFIREEVPEFLKAPVTLAFIVFVYALANQVQNEAGLLAATLLGITMGNMRLRSIDELRRLKEYVSILLVSGVFVILTADLDPHILTRLDWRSAALLAVVVFAVRPVAVLLSTAGLGMPWQERALLSWVAPRGVVAVTVAGVFATPMGEQGYADAADLLLPLVVALVLLTVALHGSTIGWVSRKLGLAATSQNGVLIVGASAWSVDFAVQLKNLKVPVLIADSNWYALSQARLSGIRTHYGEILSEYAEAALEINDMGFVLAATVNDAYNALVCSRFANDFGRNRVFQLATHVAGHEDDRKGIKYANRGVTAFGSVATKEELQRRHYLDWKFRKTRFSAELSYEKYLEGESPEALPILLAHSDGHIQIHSEQFPVKPEAGDTLLSYVPSG